MCSFLLMGEGVRIVAELYIYVFFCGCALGFNQHVYVCYFHRAYFHTHKYIEQSHSGLVLLCDISQTTLSTNLTVFNYVFRGSPFVNNI
jgi:hypothetical protein